MDLIPPGSDALLSRLRSLLVTMAIEGGYDVLIWLDHDIVWRPGDVSALAVRCAQVKGTVGGLFPYRSETMRGRGFPWRAHPNTKPADVRLGVDELLECEAVSGGFVAFWVPACRAMVEKLKDSPDPALRVSKCRCNPAGFFWDVCRPVAIPYEDGSSEKDGLLNYVSDDWVLIKRLREAGTACYAWTRPLLRHVGRKVFSVADALGWAEGADEAEEKIRKLAKAATEIRPVIWLPPMRSWVENKDQDWRGEPVEIGRPGTVCYRKNLAAMFAALEAGEIDAQVAEDVAREVGAPLEELRKAARP